MKNAKVTIIGHSDIDEKLCAAAGRISTQDGNADIIWGKSQDKDKNANLIDKVTKSGHNSTVEHTYFNMAFNDVSVVTEQFMIEFRLASFTVKSRRYVDFGNAGYIMPEFNNDEIKNKYIDHMNSLFAFYNEMVENGVPKEDARFVLPYCFKSNFFCSANGREMIHIIEAMLYGRGKDNPEIHTLGLDLLNQARNICPGIFKDFEERHQNYVDYIDFKFSPKSNNIPCENVELIDYSAEAEKSIAKSALIQYANFSKADVDEITSNEENVSEIIKNVISSNRPRPLENANYTFRINGSSLAELTHFTRHRIQSITIPPIENCDRSKYIIPESVIKAGFENKYKECFEKTCKLHCEFKNKGVETATLTYILLAGNTIDFTITMNARELMLFLSLRTCSRAQWEIQTHANKMLELLREKSPILFKYYGPSCYASGKCPEGRLSCGRIVEMKDKYGK